MSITGDTDVSPDLLVADPNSKVESGSEQGVITKPPPRDLGPFTQAHEDYTLPNYHPGIDVRNGANRNISRICKLFTHLLRSNGMRGVEYYLVIHQLTPLELDNLLKFCQLPS